MEKAEKNSQGIKKIAKIGETLPESSVLHIEIRWVCFFNKLKPKVLKAALKSLVAIFDRCELVN